MKLGIVVPAGGSATRFGGDYGKLRWPILGRPVFSWTLSALARYDWPCACKLVVAARADDHAWMSRALSDMVQFPWLVCQGGATRDASVRAAVLALGDWPTHILVHDAARPVLAFGLLERLLAHPEAPCVIPVLPSTDTLKEVVDGYVQRTVPRDTLYRVQTPQVFRAEVLNGLYAKGSEVPVTDEARLCELFGVPVKTVVGDSCNIKLTYQDELPFLEMYLSRLTDSDFISE
jgi:2-C-methyl-D-erythritol 4-phosphate cytidylyltransferase